MNIYTISQLSTIIGTRQTWYGLITDFPRLFRSKKIGGLSVIESKLNVEEISSFYQQNTRDKGRKRPKTKKLAQ